MSKRIHIKGRPDGVDLSMTITGLPTIRIRLNSHNAKLLGKALADADEQTDRTFANDVPEVDRLEARA